MTLSFERENSEGLKLNDGDMAWRNGKNSVFKSSEILFTHLLANEKAHELDNNFPR